jgi:Signal transduction histidine kinase
MDHEGKKVTVRLFTVLLVLLLILTALFGSGLWYLFREQNKEQSMEQRMQILSLNEIEEKTKINGKSPVQEEIHILQDQLKEKQKTSAAFDVVLLFFGYICSSAFLLLTFLYLYFSILKPFEKLHNFAAHIAKGEFNYQLDYERKNIFGSFTWAFDHMRREIIKARTAEKEAIENNKTVIATLSHDIKTPIASIRTYAEALEANMDTSYERKSKYLTVIMNKCEEVTNLTNDLFLHSISDLDKLSIERNPVEITPIIKTIIDEQHTAGMQIECDTLFSSPRVLGDEKRLKQVFLNVFGNADKYAHGKPVHVWMELFQEDAYFQTMQGKKESGLLCLHLKDAGAGVSPQDMPFLCDKFYRGSGTNSIPGAGLGLFIVKYVMEQLDGDVEFRNHRNGFEVILKLPYFIS